MDDDLKKPPATQYMGMGGSSAVQGGPVAVGYGNNVVVPGGGQQVMGIRPILNAEDQAKLDAQKLGVFLILCYWLSPITIFILPVVTHFFINKTDKSYTKTCAIISIVCIVLFVLAVPMMPFVGVGAVATGGFCLLGAYTVSYYGLGLIFMAIGAVIGLVVFPLGGMWIALVVTLCILSFYVMPFKTMRAWVKVYGHQLGVGGQPLTLESGKLLLHVMLVYFTPLGMLTFGGWALWVHFRVNKLDRDMTKPMMIVACVQCVASVIALVGYVVGTLLSSVGVGYFFYMAGYVAFIALMITLVVGQILCQLLCLPRLCRIGYGLEQPTFCAHKASRVFVQDVVQNDPAYDGYAAQKGQP